MTMMMTETGGTGGFDAAFVSTMMIGAGDAIASTASIEARGAAGSNQ